ncbi:glycosyl hydrolase family 11 [Apiospora arundinis]
MAFKEILGILSADHSNSGKTKSGSHKSKKHGSGNTERKFKSCKDSSGNSESASGNSTCREVAEISKEVVPIGQLSISDNDAISDNEPSNEVKTERRKDISRSHKSSRSGKDNGHRSSSSRHGKHKHTSSSEKRQGHKDRSDRIPRRIEYKTASEPATPEAPKALALYVPPGTSQALVGAFSAMIPLKLDTDSIVFPRDPSSVSVKPRETERITESEPSATPKAPSHTHGNQHESKHSESESESEDSDGLDYSCWYDAYEYPGDRFHPTIHSENNLTGAFWVEDGFYEFWLSDDNDQASEDSCSLEILKITPDLLATAPHIRKGVISYLKEAAYLLFYRERYYGLFSQLGEENPLDVSTNQDAYKEVIYQRLRNTIKSEGDVFLAIHSNRVQETTKTVGVIQIERVNQNSTLPTIECPKAPDFATWLYNVEPEGAYAEIMQKLLSTGMHGDFIYRLVNFAVAGNEENRMLEDALMEVFTFRTQLCTALGVSFMVWPDRGGATGFHTRQGFHWAGYRFKGKNHCEMYARRDLNHQPQHLDDGFDLLRSHHKNLKK